LKTETLKLAKQFTGRIFCAGDFIGVLMERKFLGEFYARASKYVPYVGVGCNATRDFNHYYKRFDKFEYRFCIDFTRWDKTVAKSLITLLCDTLCIVNPKLEKPFRALFSSIYDTLHVSGYTLFHLETGQPSGCAGTAVTNSEYNHILTFTAFSVLFKEQFGRYPTWLEFNDSVERIFYGDDQYLATCYQWFNRISISRVVADIFNMQADAMDKEGKQLEPFDQWEECNWISRYWRKLDGTNFHVGALKKLAIGGLLHWSSNMTYVQLASNLQNAIDEAVFWDESYYEEICDDVRLAMRFLPKLNGMIVIPERSTVHYNTYMESNDIRGLLGHCTGVPLEHYNKTNDSTISEINRVSQANMTFVMKLNELYQRGKISFPEYDFWCTGPGENLTWHASCSIGEQSWMSVGGSKRQAKENVAEIAWNSLQPLLSEHSTITSMCAQSGSPPSIPREIPYVTPQRRSMLRNKDFTLSDLYKEGKPSKHVQFLAHAKDPDWKDKTVWDSDLFGGKSADEALDEVLSIPIPQKSKCVIPELEEWECAHLLRDSPLPEFKLVGQSARDGMPIEKDLNVDLAATSGHSYGNATSLATTSVTLNPTAMVVDNPMASGQPFDIDTFIRKQYQYVTGGTINSTDKVDKVILSQSINPAKLEGMISAYANLHKNFVGGVEFVVIIYGAEGTFGSAVAAITTYENTPTTTQEAYLTPYWKSLSFNGVVREQFIINDQRKDGFYRSLSDTYWPGMTLILRQPPSIKYQDIVQDGGSLAIQWELFARLTPESHFFTPTSPAKALADPFMEEIPLSTFIQGSYDMGVGTNYLVKMKPGIKMQNYAPFSWSKLIKPEPTDFNFISPNDAIGTPLEPNVEDKDALIVFSFDSTPEITGSPLPSGGRLDGMVHTIYLKFGECPSDLTYTTAHALTEEAKWKFSRWADNNTLFKLFDLNYVLSGFNSYPNGIEFLLKTPELTMQNVPTGSEAHVYAAVYSGETPYASDYALPCYFHTHVNPTRGEIIEHKDKTIDFGDTTLFKFDNDFNRNQEMLNDFTFPTSISHTVSMGVPDPELFDYENIAPYTQLTFRQSGTTLASNLVNDFPGFNAAGVANLNSYLEGRKAVMGTKAIAYQLSTGGTKLADVLYSNGVHIVHTSIKQAIMRNVGPDVVITNVRGVEGAQDLSSTTSAQFVDWTSETKFARLIDPSLLRLKSQSAVAGMALAGLGTGIADYYTQRAQFAQERSLLNAKMTNQQWLARFAAQQKLAMLQKQRELSGFGALSTGGVSFSYKGEDTPPSYSPPAQTSQQAAERSETADPTYSSKMEKYVGKFLNSPTPSTSGSPADSGEGVSIPMDTFSTSAANPGVTSTVETQA
jgi:hypothetical protein